MTDIPSWTRPPRPVAPVDVSIPGLDLTDQRAASVELAEGVLHQFGYSETNSLLRPDHEA